MGFQKKGRRRVAAKFREREGPCPESQETGKLGMRGCLGEALSVGVPGRMRGLGQEATFSFPC